MLGSPLLAARADEMRRSVQLIEACGLLPALELQQNTGL